MSADFGIASIKMLGSLIVVLALIAGLFVILTRLRISPISGNRFPHMRILGSMSLAPKRSIALVEILDQWLLVGIGTESVTLIKEIPRPSEEAESVTVPQTGSTGFHALLQGIRLRPGERSGTRSERDA